ncbi:MAG: hypothetical protein ABIQ02_04195, partial [Saprospiraceae bacterium]
RGSGSAIPDTVYHYSLHLPAVDIFTEASISIPAFGINIATDSIVIVFSSNDTTEVAQNILYVDDVSIDLTSAIAPDPSMKQEVTLYPNPVRSGEMLTIRHTGKKWHDVKIEDSTGRIVNGCCTWSGDDVTSSIGPVLLSPGIYSLIVDGRNKGRFVMVE